MKTHPFLSALSIAALLALFACSPPGKEKNEEDQYDGPYVIFEINESNVVGGAMAPQAIPGGTGANLAKNAFLRPGFVFLGWATASDAGVTYSDEGYFLMSTGSGDVTLYAKWDWATYALRDIGPAGGLIFYINPSPISWKYLEAAPSDQTSSCWGTVGFNVPGADEGNILGGPSNTANISIYDTATGNKAADRCYSLSIVSDGFTFDDWWLPTRADLGQMYANLKAYGVGGLDATAYWTSYEVNTLSAMGMIFSSSVPEYNGLEFAQGKEGYNSVRAARYF